MTDNCFIVDSVQDLLNCHNVKGYGANAQVKFNGNVPAAGQLRGERRLPDPARVDDYRELRGAQRGDRAVARPQPRGLRWADAVHVQRHGAAGRRPTRCSIPASLDWIFAWPNG